MGKQKKLAEQREKRFKRMQDFAARSEVQNLEEGGVEDGEISQESNNDFYKSYYEEQDRINEEEAKEKERTEKAAEEAALRAKEAADQRAKEAAVKAAKFIKKRKAKTEEKIKQHSLAHFAKKCGDEGLLEGGSGSGKDTKDEDEQSSSSTGDHRRSSRKKTVNVDRPPKEQVAAQQEEMMTWQDRWKN